MCIGPVKPSVPPVIKDDGRCDGNTINLLAGMTSNQSKRVNTERELSRQAYTCLTDGMTEQKCTYHPHLR